MPGRLTRFLNLERPRKEDAAEPHGVANRARFSDEPPPAAPQELFEAERAARLRSGIEIDAPHGAQQPFLRCPVCEADNTRYAVRCINCQGRLDTPEVRAWNARLWEERLKQAAQEPVAPPPPPQDEQRRLGELLAQEVALTERARLDAGSTNSVVGMRLLELIPNPNLRFAVGMGLVAAFFGAGAVAFAARHHSVLQLAGMGIAVTLLALFTPARRSWRSRWWDPW